MKPVLRPPLIELKNSMSYGSSQKVQKVMVQPINLIFRYLQNRTRVSVWLYENVNTRYCVLVNNALITWSDVQD